ncbi:MAG: capsular polysaccharide biosynthesis protein/Mrp family chromosome partitioning ATPase [Candidatus Poriferisodalaceae bacterium]|jgi:capsular polysaccharide biosynthesis protein/Mrp family chromosome partitioning ATPase
MNQHLQETTAPVVVVATSFFDDLKKRWWVVVLMSLIIGAAATAMSLTAPTEYTSYGTVLVYPLGNDPGQVSRALVTSAVDLEVEAELARSYLVASTAVEALDPAQLAAIGGGDPIRGLRRSVGITQRGDRVLEISYTSENADIAQQVTAAYTTAYLSTRVDLLDATRADALSSLELSVTELTERLALVDAELASIDHAAEAEARAAAERESDQLATAAALAGLEGPITPVQPSIPTTFDQTDPTATGLLFEQENLRGRMAELDRQRTELGSLRTISGELIGPPLVPVAPTSPADIQVALAGFVAGALIGLVIVYLLSLSRTRHMLLTPVFDSPSTSAAQSQMSEATAPAPAPQNAMPAHADVPPAQPVTPRLGNLPFVSCAAAATSQPTPETVAAAASVLQQIQALGLEQGLALAISDEASRNLATPTALLLGRVIGANARVLVIATDFDTDIVGEQLGLSSQPGLTTVLAGGSATPMAVAPGVDVLHAGRPTGAEHLPLPATLAAHFRAHYDITLFAVPQLSQSVRNQFLLDVVDGCVVTVDGLHGANNQAKRAAEALHQWNIPLLGAIEVAALSPATDARVASPTAPAQSPALWGAHV